MSTIIMDLCSYTRLGLTGYLASRGIKKRDIIEVRSAQSLQERCESLRPAVVFLNEDCFIHHEESNQLIRDIITTYPDTLFVIFLCRWPTSILTTIYLYARIYLSAQKSLTPKDLDNILGNYLQTDSANNLNQLRTRIPTLSLSQAESNMLQMWMAGHATSHISGQMNIKAKKPFRHIKVILRKKSRHTINRVIYHIVRLAENITSGIYVNMR